MTENNVYTDRLLLLLLLSLLLLLLSVVPHSQATATTDGLWVWGAFSLTLRVLDLEINGVGCHHKQILSPHLTHFCPVNKHLKNVVIILQVFLTDSIEAYESLKKKKKEKKVN